MKNAFTTTLSLRSNGRWGIAGLLPAMLAVVFWGLSTPGTSPGAHTKAETEAPSSDSVQAPSTEPQQAEPAKPEAAKLDTPAGALRAYDAALPAGGMKAAEAAYQCEGANQRRAAHAMAEVDMATAELQHKVKEKFGPEAVEVVLHAARNATVKDLQEATVKIDGDHAVVTLKNNRPPVPMVKVAGKWLVSVPEVLASFGKDADLDDFVQTCDEIATQIRRTTAEFDAGDYPNVTLLELAVKQRFYRVLGEDKP